ncbi:hypothetical protein TNCV_1626611 [Trichonephila clavipes]|nr:hypothetical protein TNCV_1626611 [Trichonephila clavipes]
MINSAENTDIEKASVRIQEKAWMFVNFSALRHGGTLNSRRAASPLGRLVEMEEKWEAPDHPSECSPSKLELEIVLSSA